MPYQVLDENYKQCSRVFTTKEEADQAKKHLLRNLIRQKEQEIRALKRQLAK